MRRFIPGILSLGALCAYGGDASFPWEEFKELYRAKITYDLQTAQKAPVVPALVTFDAADYALRLSATHVEGTLELSGRLVSGLPEEVPLFGPGIVLTETVEVAGASLLPDERGGTLLLPDGIAETFHMKAAFLARAREDGGAHVLALEIPRAVTNRVGLELEDGLRLLEAPGIPGPTGNYHIATSGTLGLRFAQASALPQIQVPEVDLFTRVLVRQGRLTLETLCISMRALPEATVLRLPEGAQFVGTTLRPSSFTNLAANRYSISRSAEIRQPFVVESAISIPEDGSKIRLALPVIEGNTGREGRFVVVEPDDGQVQVQGEGLVTQIPIVQLGDDFSESRESYFMRIPVDSPIELVVNRFGTGQTIDSVSESQTLHVSFDETGRSLSTLHLELPPDAGPRLSLDPVVDSEIWSVTVNGLDKQVYTGTDGMWIVPLERGKPSVVELAFLREGEAVGLHGALQVDVPRTGLAARMLHVGVDLPDRVALVSVEGPVNTTVSGNEKGTTGLMGAPYIFTQPFYKGEGMSIVISYNEPVNSRP
jgi:hypothetical protein